MHGFLYILNITIHVQCCFISPLSLILIQVLQVYTSLKLQFQSFHVTFILYYLRFDPGLVNYKNAALDETPGYNNTHLLWAITVNALNNMLHF